VETVCEIDQSYNNRVIWHKDRKKKFFDGQLIKAVYITLLRAVIFYNNLSKHLIEHILVQNKYDMCIFHKMVNGKQITVQFQVDNLKVSHKDQAVLEDFLTNLRDEFGQEDKIRNRKDSFKNALVLQLTTQFHVKMYSQCLITLWM